MAIAWKCLDAVAAVVGGLVVFAIGKMDGGVGVGTVVGASALIARLVENGQKHGLDTNRDYRKICRNVIAEWDVKSAADVYMQMDLDIADKLLAGSLLDAVPDAADLGAAVVDIHGYPTRVSTLVVDKLAAWYPIFRPVGGEGASEVARSFAIDIITASLRSALDNPQYAQKLVPHMLVGIGRAVAETKDISIETRDLVQQILRDLRGAAPQSLTVSDNALIELAKIIGKKIDDPVSAAAEIQRFMEEQLATQSTQRRAANLHAAVVDTLEDMKRASSDGETRKALALAEATWDAAVNAKAQQAAAQSLLAEQAYSYARMVLDPDAAAEWQYRSLEMLSTNGEWASHLRALAQRGHERQTAIDLEIVIRVGQKIVRYERDPSRKSLGLATIAVGMRLQADRMTARDAAARLNEGLEHSQRAVETLSEHADLSQLVLVHFAHANIFVRQAKLTAQQVRPVLSAMRIYQMLLRREDTQNNPLYAAACHNNVGTCQGDVAHIKRKRSPQSLIPLRYYFEAVQNHHRSCLLRKAASAGSDEMSRSLCNLGEAFIDLANAVGEDAEHRAMQVYLYARARIFLNEALDLRSKTDTPHVWALTVELLSAASEGLFLATPSQVLRQQCVDECRMALDIGGSDFHLAATVRSRLERLGVS